MTPGGAASVAVAILLGFAALVCVLSVLGLMVMKGFYLKLHYLAPPAVVATAAIVIAIFVAEGANVSAFKALLVLLVLTGSNPVLTHAAARANFLRERRPKHETQEQSRQ